MPGCDHEEKHPPIHHILKTWLEPFEAVHSGAKMFEIRVEDRDFQEGDWLTLKEWSPDTGEYTGRSATRTVTYIARGPAWKLPVGLCVMSLAPMITLDEIGGTGPDLSAAIRLGQHALDCLNELPSWPWTMTEQPYV